MAPKISKTKPPETKLEPVQAIDYDIEGPGPDLGEGNSEPMPSEEEQEALRVKLRDSNPVAESESFGETASATGYAAGTIRNGETVTFDATVVLGAPQKPAEDGVAQEAGFDDVMAARREAFIEQQREAQQIAKEVALRQGGLHHGYPPHGAGDPSLQVTQAFQTPSVGRIVLFISDKFDEPQAAIITGVHDARTVDLTVFRRPLSPEGRTTTDDDGRATGKPISGYKVPYGPANGTGRRWFWPPRN